MPRTKGGPVTRRRRKKILKQAEGYFGRKSKLFRVANQQVLKSLAYAYRDRRNRQRGFRRLWLTRINAAARNEGLSYSRLIDGPRKAGVGVDRKMLADLAERDEAAFGAVEEKAKSRLELQSAELWS